ncbi:MAG: hypothetical protein JW941_12080 [Candidatus Coatesbacteria bacterium]|nr:hypothetical protein [Candidatus Coatesbacteria bacterium]
MFTNVFGQDTAVESLGRSFTDSRIASAYLFAGPAGVGKRTVALGLSRLLLCDRPSGDTPCGQCPSCKRTANFVEVHPSLMLFQDVLQPIAFRREAMMKVASFDKSQEDDYLDAMSTLAEAGILEFSPSRGKGPTQIDAIERNQAALFEKSDSKEVSLAAIDRSIELVQRQSESKTDLRPFRLAEHILRNTTAGLYQGTIKISLIRNILQQRLANRPLLGSRHLCIIDDAHKMLEPAQNALLKTLEEPPAGAVIILVTENPTALLPTILSRCQTVEFRRLSTGAVEQFLTERRGIDPDAAAIVSAFAAGSLGRAISVDPEELIERKGTAAKMIAFILEQNFESLFGIIDEAASESDESRAKQRLSVLELLDALAMYIRDAIVLKEGITAREASLLGDDPTTNSLAESCTIDRLFHLNRAITQAREKIEGNAAIRLTLEAMLLESISHSS